MRGALTATLCLIPLAVQAQDATTHHDHHIMEQSAPSQSDPPLRAYALRRKSEARTRARNCSGVLVGGAGAGACFGFTAAGAFFAASRAASRASCLPAKSFASASTVSAGAPSRAMRWSWASTAWQ
jgi:hypothetical protein